MSGAGPSQQRGKKGPRKTTAVNTGENGEYDDLLVARFEQHMADLRAEVAGLSAEDLEARVLKLEIQWGLKPDPQRPRNADAPLGENATMLQIFPHIITRFNFPDSGECTPSNIDVITKAQVTEVCAIQLACEDLEIFDNDVGLKTRLDNLLQLVYYARQSVYVTHRLRSLYAEATENVVNIDSSSMADMCGIAPFFQPQLQANALTEYQSLLLFMLKMAYHKQYRKCKDIVYHQIYNKRGKPTNAWKPLHTHAGEPMTMEYFVHDECRIMTNFDQWKNMTHGMQNVQRTAQYLEHCIDSRFPFLNKNRLVFSFDNGVYIARHYLNGNPVDLFIPHTAPRPLSKDVIACNYFTTTFRDFSDTRDWYNIPTPNLQSILDYQEFPENVCRWVYVFIGRLLYDMNDMDKWQCIPFFKGTAGSGKSTICNLISAIYDPSDVGTLSNNIEKQFGIGAFYDKYVFVAPEIKQDLKLEQAEFQSIVSGEQVQIAIKNKTARTVTWKVPGILAGNQVPGWVDNSGSIARRIALFQHNKTVKHADNRLGEKLKAEMDLILQKCNRAYIEKATECGHLNIWTQLPDYFVATKKSLQVQTNLLVAFLDESGRVEIKENTFIPFNTFTQTFNQWCRETGNIPLKLNADMYNAPFTERGVTYDLVQTEFMWQGVRTRGLRFIGIGLTSYDDEEVAEADVAGLAI